MLSPIDIVDWQPVLLSVGIMAAVVIFVILSGVAEKREKAQSKSTNHSI